MGQRRVGLRPWRSGRPADEPARRDLLRPRPADARRSAGISAPDAGMVSLPETPPDASRAAPSGWPGAVSQSPSIRRYPCLVVFSVAGNHSPMNALWGPTGKQNSGLFGLAFRATRRDESSCARQARKQRMITTNMTNEEPNDKAAAVAELSALVAPLRGPRLPDR